VGVPTRSYRSTIRAEQAQRTRRRIVAAAKPILLERGYAVTSVASVAEAAEVSTETVYVSLGGKRGLLEAVIEETILGPAGPLPLYEQSEWLRSESPPTPGDRLRAFVDFLCGVLDRTSPVHALIRGAADGEAFAVELRERLLKERLDHQARWIRKSLAGALRPGLTVRRAAEQLCALSSPELHHLLRVELGWSADRYHRWLAEIAERELLG
jgi:AcrR family transcriptional regulator